MRLHIPKLPDRKLKPWMIRKFYIMVPGKWCGQYLMRTLNGLFLSWGREL